MTARPMQAGAGRIVPIVASWLQLLGGEVNRDEN
jgi:hypothetical protein